MTPTFYALRNFALLLTICLNGLLLHAQWKAFTPSLLDTVGIHSLDISQSDPKIAWAIATRYKADSFTYDLTVPTRNYFIQTANAGVTWKATALPTAGGLRFYSNISAVNASNAWVCGIDQQLSTISNFILRTTDGATWQPRGPALGFKDPNSFINFVHFWDTQRGIASGDPVGITPLFEIYSTSNGGQTWTQVNTASIPPEEDEYGYSDAYQVIGDNIWVGTVLAPDYTPHRLLRSQDGGATWKAFKTPGSLDFFSFADAQNGAGASLIFEPAQATQYWVTADGGANWTKGALVPGGWPSSLAIIPQSKYILSVVRGNNLNGPFRTLLSKDNGATFTEIGAGEHAGSAEFASPTIGYAGEWQPVGHQMQMYQYAGSPLSGLFSPATLEAEVRISPNPANDHFQVQIQASEPDDYLLLLNDLQGRLIQQKTMDKTASGSIRFEVGTLPAGTYTLTLSNAKGHLTRTVLKR